MNNDDRRLPQTSTAGRVKGTTACDGQRRVRTSAALGTTTEYE
jgi:hypothetical protein